MSVHANLHAEMIRNQRAKPLLVGEDNPYGSDPRYALYCETPNSAGGRLCRLVLGLSRREYICAFDRVNLCANKWSAPEAKRNANLIMLNREAPVVLLGAKVASAFGEEYEPFTHLRRRWFTIERPGLERTIVKLPHPSGRCRAWNGPEAYERARSVLREAGVLS